MERYWPHRLPVLCGCLGMFTHDRVRRLAAPMRRFPPTKQTTHKHSERSRSSMAEAFQGRSGNPQNVGYVLLGKDLFVGTNLVGVNEVGLKLVRVYA